MAERLAGKVAIVTGAGSRGEGVGTGKAIATLFAREGARVCLVDLNPDRAAETETAIKAEGGEACVVAGDVTNPEDCARIVQTALDRYGSLTTLVNNVGISDGDVTGDKLARYRRVMEVNLTSVVLMTEAAVPHIAAAGGGAVINLSSVAGIRGHGGIYGYSASKSGMIGLSRDCAVAYGRQLIRFNVIAPGHVYTPMVAGTMSEQGRKERRQIAPLGIEGNAWDVGWAAVYLASDEARFISGVVIPVDGGVIQTAPIRAAHFLDE